VLYRNIVFGPFDDKQYPCDEDNTTYNFVANMLAHGRHIRWEKDLNMKDLIWCVSQMKHLDSIR